MYQLTENWHLKFTAPDGSSYDIPACVPGNVIGDLVRSGILPDPFFGTNSHKTYPWEKVCWLYENTFRTP